MSRSQRARNDRERLQRRSETRRHRHKSGTYLREEARELSTPPEGRTLHESGHASRDLRSSDVDDVQ